MIELTASVGLKGINNPADTGNVQKLLNQNRHNDPASREISEDNVIGPQTISAIKQFQKVVVKLRTPDSRVDPGGKTLSFLKEGAIAGNYMEEPLKVTAPASPLPVSGMGPGLKVGSDVKRGQLIAYVGELRSGAAMLHIEMYTGTGLGRLTVRGNKPYQRRSDLTDPTPILDDASMA